MSIRHQAWVLKQSIKPSARKFVALVLADYVTDTGKTYPSVKTIAFATSMSMSQVQEQLKGLVEVGLIKDTGKRIGEQSETTVFEFASPQEFQLKPQEPKERKRKTPLPEALQDAEKIYNAYPRKIGKPKALQSIARCVKQYGLDPVLQGVELFAKLWKESGKDMSFCPHPATFFNQERFNDSPEAWGFDIKAKVTQGPAYSDILSYVKEKEADETRAKIWAMTFYNHHRKTGFMRNEKAIDWKSELQNQLGKWRTKVAGQA